MRDFQREWLERIERLARVDEVQAVEPDTYKVVRCTLPASEQVAVFRNLTEDEARRLVEKVLKSKVVNKKARYYDYQKETL